jgi:undecaprenyl-diphosphatase
MSLVQTLARLDRITSERVAELHHSRPARLAAHVGAHSADSPVVIAVVLTAIALSRGSNHPPATRTLAATLLSAAATTILKWAFRRGRPSGPRRGFYWLLDQHAFPSGHAARTAAVTVAAAPMLPPGAVTLLVTWNLVVGWSRVALRVHYISDILAGWIAGCASAAVASCCMPISAHSAYDSGVFCTMFPAVTSSFQPFALK